MLYTANLNYIQFPTIPLLMENAFPSPGKIILLLFHIIMPSCSPARQRSQSVLVWAVLVAGSLAAYIRVCFSCCQALYLCIIRQYKPNIEVASTLPVTECWDLGLFLWFLSLMEFCPLCW